MLLRRGQFRVSFRIERQEDSELVISKVRNAMRYVETEDGPKRVWVYSITAEPGEPAETGEDTYRVVAVFTVLDNPIWLVPALYALTAGVATVGGWFLVDKVETFSGSTVGTVLSVAAAALTIFVLYKALT